MLKAIRDAILYRFKGFEFLVLASLFLSGCAHYDVGIQFDSQTQGVIVQHIRLGERLTASSGPSTQQWLTQLEQQALQLGAQVRHSSKRELAIVLPFNNAADLTEKFNNFWGPGETVSLAQRLGLPEIPSHLSVSQRNWLLVLHNHLTYDLDLQGVGSPINLNNGFIESGGLLDLEFSLTTPWGIEALPSSQRPQSQKQERVQVWSLKPGQLNHIEVTFWLPSPIGIGALFIILMVSVGYFMKHGLGRSAIGHGALGSRSGMNVKRS
ncbi:MAG: DUF3153 domain-containing protein [Leptolyngbyaceae cyanobacterium MO_188.B28]|nr:DUF3153 domain-containing protein [Leptolyngbyaceae cyanobacterium MO_188.B28]